TSLAGSRIRLSAKPLAQRGCREESGLAVDGPAIPEQQQRRHAPDLVLIGKFRKSLGVDLARTNPARGLRHRGDYRLDLSTNDAVLGVDVDDRQLRRLAKSVELLLRPDVGQ